MLKVALRGAAMLLLLHASDAATACRFEHFELRENISASDAAFVAVVLQGAARGGSAVNPVARMRVDAVLKGKVTVGSEVAVESRFGTCGIEFVAGQRWVVVAQRERRVLWTSQPVGSLLLTDQRGLHQRPAWDQLRRAARPGQLDALAARDNCLRVRTELMDFFDRLPRACRADTDCVADQYIDTQACYPPVVTNRSRVPLAKVEELYALQRRERAACIVDSARVPACGPITVPVACVAGTCAVRR